MCADNSQELYFGYRLPTNEFVEFLPPVADMRLSARLVAFYLPQFHPIPENDRAWGEGFTEWTNVTRAVPQFEGHYQPHLPAHLGFYDLRLPEIQLRQTELATRAGVSAFCFHFYWFNGHRVLETPIINFANNNDIRFEFCLCWANENWTKRWDGQDQDVILHQEYGDDDDMAFIRHISGYLRNPKYLRIDGKPLLIVYRPSLLPDMKGTASRWREWCLENGIGEIHLAYCQTFEKTDPSIYGLDSAIQFPPNDSRWKEETFASYKNSLNMYNRNYTGEVYDYDDLLNKAENFERPAYRLHRGAFPSWDNEARMPGRGKTVLNSAPSKYGRYLDAVIAESLASDCSTEKPLVFINAWNEWAEGAHLEPDRRYGMAHLEATRMAQLRQSRPAENRTPDNKLAIVIHVYYPHLLEEILNSLQGVEQKHHFFITTPLESEQSVRSVLATHGIEATLFLRENRGRDIAPFLDVIRYITVADFPFVLKLHTKYSPHRDDGTTWRKQLLEGIGTPQSISRSIRIFGKHENLGIIGPCGHLLSMEAFLNHNETMVRNLSSRMGLQYINPAADSFVAGTMFIARTASLLPLACLGIDSRDFEQETGQVNGTLAHAIERAITYSAHVMGYDVGAFATPPSQNSESIVLEGRKSYEFARSTA